MSRVVKIILTGLLAIVPKIVMGDGPDRLVSGFAMMPIYNPAAVTGVHDKAQVNLAGVLGKEKENLSSRSALLQGSAPFNFGGLKAGIGFDAGYFKLGGYNSVTSHIELSTAIKIGDGFLSAGVAPGFTIKKMRQDEITATDDNTDTKSTGSHSLFSLNAGIQYEKPRFYIGAAVTGVGEKKITENSSDKTDVDKVNRPARLARFTGGANIPVGPVEIKPSLMVSTDFSYSRTDLLARFRFMRRFTVGGGWSTSRMAVIIAGIDLHDFHIGYAYTFSTSDINFKRYHHEIFAGYSFKINLTETNRYGSKSIRFM